MRELKSLPLSYCGISTLDIKSGWILPCLFGSPWARDLKVYESLKDLSLQLIIMSEFLELLSWDRQMVCLFEGPYINLISKAILSWSLSASGTYCFVFGYYVLLLSLSFWVLFASMTRLYPLYLYLFSFLNTSLYLFKKKNYQKKRPQWQSPYASKKVREIMHAK